MKIILILPLILVIFSSTLSIEDLPALSSEDIAQINSIQNEWIAEENWLTRMPLKEVRKMFQAIPLHPDIGAPVRLFPRPRPLRKFQRLIPNAFDASVQWPDCVVPVGDRGSCNASWAFAVTAVASERLCISNPTLYKGMNLSPQYLVCTGGSSCSEMFVHDAWNSFASYGSAVNTCLPWKGQTTCSNTCDNGTPVTVIKANQTSVYEAHSQTGIQQELLDGGSVSSTMTVYADFLGYKSGVYYKTNNTIIGIQTVKIYGWGVNSTGTQYWICANSVGTSWGISGIFQIAFGNCGIDALGVIGLLNLD